jgi:hypothetical protein
MQAILKNNNAIFNSDSHDALMLFLDKAGNVVWEDQHKRTGFVHFGDLTQGQQAETERILTAGGC